MRKERSAPKIRSTTVLLVKRDGQIAMAGDGQVTLGETVIKGNARKVRRIGDKGEIIAGFAGATADAFTLFERLEQKLERFPGNLQRAAKQQARGIMIGDRSALDIPDDGFALV